jgi:hypothetical protein
LLMSEKPPTRNMSVKKSHWLESRA